MLVPHSVCVILTFSFLNKKVKPWINSKNNCLLIEINQLIMFSDSISPVIQLTHFSHALYNMSYAWFFIATLNHERVKHFAIDLCSLSFQLSCTCFLLFGFFYVIFFVLDWLIKILKTINVNFCLAANSRESAGRHDQKKNAFSKGSFFVIYIYTIFFLFLSEG